MPSASYVRVSVLALALLSGCSSTVRVRVAHPPLLPVRVYATIVVLHRDAPNERTFAEGIAAHLRDSSDASVQVMTEAEIARLPTGLPAGSVVLQMRLDTAQSMRLSYVPTYANSCGFYSCTPTTMTTAVPVVTMTTRLSAMMRDGVTANVLVARSVDEQGELMDVERVLARLYRHLVLWVDGRPETLSVPVRSTRDPRIAHAVEDLEAGRFGEARTALEAVVADPSFAQESRKTRSRTLFAVAVARRFDPAFGDDVGTRFAAARDACVASLALVDDGHTRTFCGRLASDEADAAALRAMQLDAVRLRAGAAQSAPSSADAVPQPEGAAVLPPPVTSTSGVMPVPDPAYSGAR